MVAGGLAEDGIEEQENNETKTRIHRGQGSIALVRVRTRKSSVDVKASVRDKHCSDDYAIESAHGAHLSLLILRSGRRGDYE